MTIIIHYIHHVKVETMRQSTTDTYTATIAKYNVPLTFRNVNAHVVSHDTATKFRFNQLTKYNGKLAIDYLEEADIITINIHFQKIKGKLCTFLSDT